MQSMSHILFLGNFTELSVRNVLINVNTHHEHKDLDVFKKGIQILKSFKSTKKKT